MQLCLRFHSDETFILLACYWLPSFLDCFSQKNINTLIFSAFHFYFTLKASVKHIFYFECFGSEKVSDNICSIGLILNHTLLSMKHFILLLIVAALVSADTTNITTLIWPKPESFSSDPNGPTIKVSPCQVDYSINSSLQANADNIISWYLSKVLGCSFSPSTYSVILSITITDGTVLLPTETIHERYSLTLNGTTKWTLSADYYPGFLRGLETFFQLFTKNDQGESIVSGLPIQVIDGPQFKWRGLMIDTSRHFLPMTTVRRAIDSIAFSKLNVLHWHIIDEDAFPMQVPTVPELSEYGSVGGLISPADIRSIIDYAKDRGIRVVPEIDTPAHTRSWGRSPKYQNLTLDCNGIYMGQFDPTINITWEVVQEVMDFVNQTFDDQYIHLGGDETVHECWLTRQSIVDWMAANNMTDPAQLSVYYRQKQKQLFRSRSPKKAIYWANEEIDLPVQADDVIQWWGVSANVNRIVGRNNDVILANMDEVYLDFGFNNMYGVPNGVFSHWRQAYGFQPRVANVSVIGGESCMWAENTNKHNFDQKVTQRSAVVGERLWNDQVNLDNELNNIATRLTTHTARLRERGFKVWPVTVGVCEQSMDICF